MANRRSYVSDCLRIDPRCRSEERPHKWPQTPKGRMGKRWFVLDGEGVVIGEGDVGNPRSAWVRALRTLEERAKVKPTVNDRRGAPRYNL